MFKKVFFILGILLLFNLSSISVFAAPSNENWILTEDEFGNEILLETNSGKSIGQSFEVDKNGVILPISLSERLTIIETMPSIDDTSKIITYNTYTTPESKQMPNLFYKYRYVRSSTYSSTGSIRKVSPDIGFGGTVSYGNSTTIANSFSGSASAQYGIAESIKLNAGFTWQTSLASNTSSSITFTNNKWPKAYIGFTPYYNSTVGTGYRDTYNGAGIKIETENMGIARGHSPKKLASGFSDGLYDMYRTY